MQHMQSPCHVHVHHACLVPCNPGPASTLLVTPLCQALFGPNLETFLDDTIGGHSYVTPNLWHTCCMQYLAGQGVCKLLKLNGFHVQLRTS